MALMGRCGRKVLLSYKSQVVSTWKASSDFLSLSKSQRSYKCLHSPSDAATNNFRYPISSGPCTALQTGLRAFALAVSSAGKNVHRVHSLISFRALLK